MTIIRKSLFATMSCAAVAALTLSSAAQAQTHSVSHTDPAGMRVRVQFAELDTTRTEHAILLLRSLDGAAQQVCGGRPGADVRRRRAHEEFELCREEAVAAAVRRIRSPELTAAARGDLLVSAR